VKLPFDIPLDWSKSQPHHPRRYPVHGKGETSMAISHLADKRFFPNLKHTDFSVAKRTSFFKRYAIEIKLDAFNILNS
jgi:hypothetical protein